MDRAQILSLYPWLYDNSPKNLIMGDDLDAAMSTLLFLRYNPNAKLVGIYTKYNTLYYNVQLQNAELVDCIYVDLDIYKPKFRSIGHHIVRYSPNDVLSGFQSSCNLNELVGRMVTQQFYKKYPLGTIHFFIWLFDAKIPSNPYAEQMVWLADSSYINGQSHRFRANMQQWLHELMVSDELIKGFDCIDTPEFEDKMQELYFVMQSKGFNQGSGSVASRFRNLKGFQCQPSGKEEANGIKHYMYRILQAVAEILGWQLPHTQLNFDTLTQMKGERHTASLQEIIVQHSLNDFLKKQDVFSYVFPYKNAVNFTVNMK